MTKYKKDGLSKENLQRVREMKADKRKKAILDCAKKLFSERGYYQTHISDIVKEVQIARGTVYQYFDNKDDIFITLVEDYYSKWRSMVSIEQANMPTP